MQSIDMDGWMNQMQISGDPQHHKHCELLMDEALMEHY